jgi:hypothetical protein
MTYYFSDYPSVRPNVSPREMFEKGILGGTYYRELKNPFDGRVYKDEYKHIPGLENLPSSIMSSNVYDKEKNKYKVRAGSSFENWYNSGWLRDQSFRGWIHWYSKFFAGVRSYDDARQISRWLKFAGPNGRFRKRYENIIAVGQESPIIAQNLLEWGWYVDKMRF